MGGAWGAGTPTATSVGGRIVVVSSDNPTPAPVWAPGGCSGACVGIGRGRPAVGRGPVPAPCRPGASLVGGRFRMRELSSYVTAPPGSDLDGDLARPRGGIAVPYG